MISVDITVESFDHFLQTFSTQGQALRLRHGSRGAEVLRHADDDERVTLLFDWDAAAFAGFLADPEVKASMLESGTLGPPRITYLAHAETLTA